MSELRGRPCSPSVHVVEVAAVAEEFQSNPGIDA